MNKPLLILDIDETLVFASHEKSNDLMGISVFDYIVYERPYLQKFLDSVYPFYLMAIWSSAGDEYVQEVVEKTILRHYTFEFIWGRSRATFRRNIEMDESREYTSDSNHYHYVKPLKKVKRIGYNLKRTLIIDDTPHKSKLNYGNAIYPIPFEGHKNDDELKKLASYLIKIRNTPNFRTIEKRGWKNKVSDQNENSV
ncbi:MAG: HAD family hydrolase [Saprospiraceae bacterium]|nr:HAD family hydrolase [Saprospiraceae bacterium]